MSNSFQIPAKMPAVSLLPPATDAAGRTSGYRSLKNAHKAFIVARVNQGNAAQVTFTPLQATSAAGAGSKAIFAAPIWLCVDTATIDTLVKQTAAANFQTSTGTTDKIVVFEIEPGQSMDINNGFSYIGLQTSASNVANITEALLLIVPRYEQANPPSTYS
jgi:hypothetical protein